MGSASQTTKAVMDSVKDNRCRIKAAIHVDFHFDTFEIEMTAEEALLFACERNPIGPKGAYDLITVLNRITLGSGSVEPKTFIVGRRLGNRILILELFKGLLSRDMGLKEFVALVRAHAEKAGASFEHSTSDTVVRFIFSWD